jgi:protein-S-isoprenylcysteine O-methyltransferase Ste14
MARSVSSAPDSVRPVTISPTRTYAVMTIRMAALGAFFFVPAGTLRWPQAWLLLAIYLTYAVLVTTWLRKHDPELLQERLRGSPIQPGQKGWDKILAIGFVVVGIPLLILPGLDAVRYQWTRMPAVLVALGLAAHIPGFFWIFSVMKENTYLSRVVKIDVERGQEVITTGPYRVVRHPMYAAVIMLVLCMPLALGSWVSLIPTSLMVLLLLVRTALEDKTLHEELEGYAEYAAQTPYRIVPGMW